MMLPRKTNAKFPTTKQTKEDDQLKFVARVLNQDNNMQDMPGLNQNQPGMNDTTTGNTIMQTIKNLAKDPRTYSTLANIGSIYAATQDDPTTASALSEVASRIDTGVQQKQAAEATVEAEILKLQKDQQKADEDFRKERRSNLENLQTKTQTDQSVKKGREALYATDVIRDLVSSNSPLAAAALKTQFPRLMGEVGNLTAQEQQVWSGDPKIVSKIDRAYETYIATGKLREEDKEIFINLLNTLEKAHKGKLQNELDKIIKSQSVAYPEFYTEGQLQDILYPRYLTPKKSKEIKQEKKQEKRQQQQEEDIQKNTVDAVTEQQAIQILED